MTENWFIHSNTSTTSKRCDKKNMDKYLLYLSTFFLRKVKEKVDMSKKGVSAGMTANRRDDESQRHFMIIVK